MLAPKDVEKLLKECEECDFEYMKKKIKKQQQLLEQKDKRIDDLEKSLYAKNILLESLGNGGVIK